MGPFQTTQGNRLSCRDQEGRGGSEEAVLGPSVFPSNRGLPLRRVAGKGLLLPRGGKHVVFLELWSPRLLHPGADEKPI